MPTHHFTLIVEGEDLQDEAVIDRLFEAGCGDALVSSTDGVQFVDFDRDAASMDAAILSAVVDVERVSGIRVVRLASATLASVAGSIGATRESVLQSHTFPPGSPSCSDV